ncbi:zinc finger protein, partial [Wuchereria bancrofti]
MPKKHTTSNKTRKRKGKDMDQIIEEIRSEKRRCFTVRQINFDLDLPGDGQFYCVECDRHFIDEKSLRSHRSSKVHRQRLKRLREPVYTQHEAEESV